MDPLPTQDLRSNVGTWSVPSPLLPALAHQMTQALPLERFDPAFAGQDLCTTYLDTPKFDLYKARRRRDRYLTLRIRAYPNNTYAISAKTESQKYRRELDPTWATSILAGALYPDFRAQILPANLLARLMDLADEQVLQPIVAISFRRYAVEDDNNRLTLDCDIRTDTGKLYPSHVLEQKTAGVNPDGLLSIQLRPIKLSKFLWSMQ